MKEVFGASFQESVGTLPLLQDYSWLCTEVGTRGWPYGVAARDWGLSFGIGVEIANIRRDHFHCLALVPQECERVVERA